MLKKWKKKRKKWKKMLKKWKKKKKKWRRSSYLRRGALISGPSFDLFGFRVIIRTGIGSGTGSGRRFVVRLFRLAATATTERNGRSQRRTDDGLQRWRHRHHQRSCKRTEHSFNDGGVSIVAVRDIQIVHESQSVDITADSLRWWSCCCCCCCCCCWWGLHCFQCLGQN